VILVGGEEQRRRPQLVQPIADIVGHQQLKPIQVSRLARGGGQLHEPPDLVAHACAPNAGEKQSRGGSATSRPTE
jgi:hypothetical protein